MDHARPSGVVLDGAFGIELLDKETQGLFVADNVCVRGVAEIEPVTVYTLKGVVEIPEEARRPIRPEVWELEGYSLKLREWKTVEPRFAVPLTKRLKRSDEMRVHLVHRARRGRKAVSGMDEVWELEVSEYQYEVIANLPMVIVNVNAVLEYAKGKRMTLAEELTVRVAYVPE
jgi:hypothetical protein